METIRKELIQQELDKIKKIESRITELEEYKIELEEFYNKLMSELSKKE